MIPAADALWGIFLFGVDFCVYSPSLSASLSPSLWRLPNGNRNDERNIEICAQIVFNFNDLRAFFMFSANIINDNELLWTWAHGSGQCAVLPTTIQEVPVS